MQNECHRKKILKQNSMSKNVEKFKRKLVENDEERHKTTRTILMSTIANVGPIIEYHCDRMNRRFHLKRTIQFFDNS